MLQNDNRIGAEFYWGGRLVFELEDMVCLFGEIQLLLIVTERGRN